MNNAVTEAAGFGFPEYEEFTKNVLTYPQDDNIIELSWDARSVELFRIFSATNKNLFW
jgi:hypothetical protein